MTSQTDIAQTSFLEDCISKNRSFQDIYEALGLYSQTTDARKVPVFVPNEANDLHKKIKKIAASFKASHRNNTETLLASLAKDNAFANQIQELGQCYGPLIWGRGNHRPWQYDGGQVPTLVEFRWDGDQGLICFYVRCWITRHAVQGIMPLKGKARADAALRLPMTPNKRKASSVPGQPASKKLQKMTEEMRPSEGLLRGQQCDIYSITRSTAPVFQTLPTGLAHRSQRESTCDTDRTCAPAREVIPKAETTIDVDEVMLDTQELLLEVGISNDEEISRSTRSPTAGPSGTYRNLQRHDSVILPSTQPNESCYQANKTLPTFHGLLDTTKGIWQSTSVPTSEIDVYKLEKWQEKPFRMDLFKLLLSYLNGLNQFSTVFYEPEAEDRMNHLLDQFWKHDEETIRSRMVIRFPELQTAWHGWTIMRHQLAKFQRTTGYFGRPGNDWKEHLRKMDSVTHAKASIAFVDFKSFPSAGALATDGGSQFDDDIMTVFDSLTQVEGCDGVGEFQALRVYNEGLLGWFS